MTVTVWLKWRNSLENGLVMKRQSRTFNGKGEKKSKKKKGSCNSLVGKRRVEGEREKRGNEKINKRTVLRREREREREWGVDVLNRKWMTWNVVGVRIMTWWCLEEGKFFFSVLSFNLYYRYIISLWVLLSDY